MNKDTELLRYQEKERGGYIDNLYRARVLNSYVDVPFSLVELREMWTNYLQEAQRHAI